MRFLIRDRDSKFSRVRRSLPDRGRRDHPHPVSGTQRERLRRTLGRHGPPRLPRLAAHHEPKTARACDARLRRALQHPQAAPRARPETARTSASSPPRRPKTDRPAPTPRAPRRPHQRIRPSSMKNGFTYPTRAVPRRRAQRRGAERLQRGRPDGRAAGQPAGTAPRRGRLPLDDVASPRATVVVARGAVDPRRPPPLTFRGRHPTVRLFVLGEPAQVSV